MSVETYPVASPRPHALHAPVAYLSAGCLVGGFFTDLTYMRNAEMTWADFSAWLISAGAILGIIALLVGLVDIARRPRRRSGSMRLLYPMLSILALVLGILNMFVHSRDAWTSVVPWGLTLSALTSILVILSAIARWTSLSDLSAERPRP